MTTEKVAIVIPALNEEGALRSLLVEIPGEFARWIIVVDNASTDATAAVASAAGAIVASEPIRGYGRACLQGLKLRCWSRLHERVTVSLNCPFTIAIAATAVLRWLAQSSAVLKLHITCCAQLCATQGHGGRRAFCRVERSGTAIAMREGDTCLIQHSL